jgi:hypothetical protein
MPHTGQCCCTPPQIHSKATNTKKIQEAIQCQILWYGPPFNSMTPLLSAAVQSDNQAASPPERAFHPSHGDNKPLMMKIDALTLYGSLPFLVVGDGFPFMWHIHGEVFGDNVTLPLTLAYPSCTSTTLTPTLTSPVMSSTNCK